jgi:lysozyme
VDIYEQLRRDEGSRQFPYKDTKGKLTIGVGHNLTDKGLNEVAIDFILKLDVGEVREALSAALPWFTTLSDARQGVLLNMGFNLGIAGLLAFHRTLGFMEASDWNSAANEMLQSKWALDVGTRASRLAEQLMNDQWL